MFFKNRVKYDVKFVKIVIPKEAFAVNRKSDFMCSVHKDFFYLSYRMNFVNKKKLLYTYN